MLALAEKAGVRKATLTGVVVGLFLGTLFVVYGVSLLWGAQLVIWSRLPSHGGNAACRYDPTVAGCFTGGTVIEVRWLISRLTSVMGATGTPRKNTISVYEHRSAS